MASDYVPYDMLYRAVGCLVSDGDVASGFRLAAALGKDYVNMFKKNYQKEIDHVKSRLKVGDVFLEEMSYPERGTPKDIHVYWQFVTKITKRFMYLQMLECEKIVEFNEDGTRTIQTRPVLAVDPMWKATKRWDLPKDLTQRVVEITKTKNGVPFYYKFSRVSSKEYNEYQPVSVI